MIAKKIDVVICSESNKFNNIVDGCFDDDGEINVVGYARNLDALKRYTVSHKNFVVVFYVTERNENDVLSVADFLKGSNIGFITVCENNAVGYDCTKRGALAMTTWTESGGRVEDQRLMRNLRMKIKDAQRTVGDNSRQAVINSVPIARTSDKLIVIGASTGGTEAVLAVLKELPANMPPILIVQHMPAGFTQMYANRMNDLCQLNVCEAKDGDALRNGLALIAPGDFPMKLVRSSMGYSVSVFKSEKVNGVRPAVDILFDSVADLNVRNVIAVILTGMGSDGAKSMLRLRRNGAYTIGQNEASCVVYGMPKAAYDIGAVEKQADLNGIAKILIEKSR